MAEIQGLKEQQEALKRVGQNIKRVEEINAFLKNVSALAGNKDVNVAYNVVVSFEANEDMKRFKSTMLVDDNRYILDSVQRYKDSVVAEVRKDAAEYRIALSPKESATLDWALT